MLLKDGSESDVRGAYSLAADEEVESIGPIDPSIGVLRLDRLPEVRIPSYPAHCAWRLGASYIVGVHSTVVPR
jgi:hypothetical protein